MEAIGAALGGKWKGGIVAYWIVFVAVMARFIPHPTNFVPLYAALLFAGAWLRSRDSLWFPVALAVASDFVLATLVYRTRMNWDEVFMALALASVVLAGRAIRGRVSFISVAVAALAGALAFVVISNFGVWLLDGLYARTWQGLRECFLTALPFFANTVLSSLLFSALLFGAYAWYQRRVAPAEPAKAL